MKILVTGAGKGIGYEMTKLALTNNHEVFAVSRNVESLSKLQFQYPNLVTVATDITSENAADIILKKLEKTLGWADVLINNAGAIINKPFAEISKIELQNIYDINVFSPFLLIQKLLPLFKKSTHKHIVNISSMGGVMGTAKFPGLSAYSSSKGALSILTECLAEELKSQNITVNALALGAVNTKMLQAAFPDYKANTEPEQMAKFILDFALQQPILMNGKVVSVSNSTP